MKRNFLFSLFLVAVLVGPLRGECFDHDIWDGIVKVNVDDDGYINYDNIRINKGGDIYQYISFAEVARLRGCTQEEKIAFWINTLNANIVKLILANPSLVRLRDDPGLKDRGFKVARIKMSMTDIEGIFLKYSGGKESIDPRIHCVIMTGAVGSPSLLQKAVRGPTLADQLEEAAGNFINNAKSIRLGEDRLVLSTLFRDYRADFQADGGVVAFINKYIDSSRRDDADAIKERLATDYPDNVQYEFDDTINHILNKKK